MNLTFWEFTCKWDHAVFVFLCLAHLLQITSSRGLPGGTSDKESTCNTGDPRDAGSFSGSGRSRRRKWQPAAVFLPGKSHGQRSLAGYSWWGCNDLDTIVLSYWAQYPWDSPMLLPNTGSLHSKIIGVDIGISQFLYPLIHQWTFRISNILTSFSLHTYSEMKLLFLEKPPNPVR